MQTILRTLFAHNVLPGTNLGSQNVPYWSKRLWQICGGLLLLSALLLSSCTTLGQYLETREGQGCYRLEGHARAYVVIHGLLATGGATLAECASYHNLGGGRLYQAPVPKETPTAAPPDWLLWE